MGLDLGEDLCYQNVRSIVEHAQKLDNFIRIDMEGSGHTDRTLAIYRKLKAEGFENVGIVIQTYLYRSSEDLKILAQKGLNVRICKGAYSEPEEIAFPQKRDVDKKLR